MATADFLARFGRWRRGRPFWGGLLLLLAASVLFLSANLSLGDLQVHFGMEGYLSYVLPVVLVLCGLLAWLSPGQRHFYAIIGLLTSLYSLMGLNLGGFGAGMLLGILGGALVMAWTPSGSANAPTFTPAPSTPTSTQGEKPAEASPATEPPPFAEAADPRESRDRRGVHRTLMVIALAPLLVSAGVLAAGHAPARADDDCPAGVPSRSTSAKGEPAKKNSAKGNSSGAKGSGKDDSQETKAVKSPKSSDKKAPTADATPTETAAGDPDQSNPVADGWHDFVEGVGDLFGVGDDPSPAPSGSAAPPASPTPPVTPTPTPALPGVPPRKPPANAPGTTPTPSQKPGEIPCLGPRVLNKKAGDDGTPQVSIKAGIMTGDVLEMFDSTYDGVAELDTAEGTKRVLKFSMRKSVTTPFTLAVPERGGRTSLIESGRLTTTGNVRFYTKRFTGKLFGLIPVTFTPEQPPPLTLPYLRFTDVDIDLDFVRSDVLTAKPFKITEKS